MGLAVRKPEYMVAFVASVFCLLGLFLDVRDFGRRLWELLRGIELFVLLACLPVSSFCCPDDFSGHLSAKWPTFLHLEQVMCGRCFRLSGAAASA